LPWRRPASRSCQCADCESCWTDLSSPDARVALGAIEELASDPERAVPFLAKRLRPPAVQQRRIARLIADLDSDEYRIRKQASTELRRLGETATGELRATLAGKLSLQARRSIERLLKGSGQSPDQVALIRAVEALERCRTPAARALLERLHRHKAPAWFRQEVQAALARLPYDDPREPR
jgi:hypothetical protein